jgi:DNA-binding HxlR family transcriptional regulator
MAAERHWPCDDAQFRTACASSASEALRCIEGKWKMILLSQLFALGTLRFSELERLVAGITQKMLAQQLRELERDGIVKRTVHAQVPPKVEYALTDLGHALGPALAALLDWVERRRRSAAAHANVVAGDEAG